MFFLTFDNASSNTIIIIIYIIIAEDIDKYTTMSCQ